MHYPDHPQIDEFIRGSGTAKSKQPAKADRYDRVPENHPCKNTFQIRTANQLMRNVTGTPKPKMLFGEFWYEGELCILFADTNAGKSILAVQIANSLATKTQVGSFHNQAEQCKVVYIDFELSAVQFQARYSDDLTEAPVQFGKGLYRAAYNPMTDMPPGFQSYEDYIDDAIEYAVRSTQAEVLVIDNITCLGNDTHSAFGALPLMRKLKALKTRLQISILVLAHTPKRNPAKPITRNDLQGSKMLINFCDSAFAIGESNHEKHLRYLKQVKQRSTHQIYGEDNVCVCRIKKPGASLQFEFDGYARERDHLFKPAMHAREILASRIVLLNQQGLSQRKISARLRVGLGTVNRMLKAV